MPKSEVRKKRTLSVECPDCHSEELTPLRLACLLLFRIKIMQNIGVTFIKTGQYSDAINSFEHVMSVAPSLKAGFNLILSYFAIGDREKMKKAFQKLIAVPLEIDEDDKYISPSVSTRRLRVASSVSVPFRPQRPKGCRGGRFLHPALMC